MSRQNVLTVHTSAVASGRRSADVGLAPDAVGELVETHIASPPADVWRRFRQNRVAVVSFLVLISLVFAALFAPFLHTTDPIAVDYSSLDQGPSSQHWLGTDGVGGDLYSRLLYGLRVPLLVGFAGAAITVTLGTLLGVVAGYHGGIVDSLLSRFTDLMFAFPGFLLALVIASSFGRTLDPYFGGAGRVLLLTGVLSLVGWPALMRFARALTLGLREQQFTEAARAFGSSSQAIIIRHFLPNLWGPIAVQASFIVVNMIGVESALSLFGLGVRTPNPDLGVMLFYGKDVLAVNPWELLVPAVTLGAIVLTGTFVGDGLRDALDPGS